MFGIIAKTSEYVFEMSETKDYKELSAKLIERWQQENLALHSGATEKELSTFENCHALTLPTDFRYFYSLVNGMRDWQWIICHSAYGHLHAYKITKMV